MTEIQQIESFAPTDTHVPPPPPPPMPSEIPLQEYESLMVDAIKWREASAQKSLALANKELDDVGKMKQELIRRCVVKYGINTSEYNFSIDSGAKKLRIEKRA